MKKIILTIILSIMVIGITSCEGNNVFLGEDSSIASFSYDRFYNYFNHQGLEELKENPSGFKNTQEIKIKNEKHIIELAKNELKIEYNQINVYYDNSKFFQFSDSNSMWLVVFYAIDEQNESYYSQRICIDDKGITQLIAYSSLPPEVDINEIQSFSYGRNPEDEIEDPQRDPSTYRNTTETKIRTTKDVIALATNELVWEYDYIYVFYDELTCMWQIGFYSNYWIGLGQGVYMTSKGITKWCGYGYDDLLGDIFYNGAVLRSSDADIRDLELNGGMRRNENQYKNTTETETTTNKDAVELAKNEVTIKYDRLFVGFDEKKSIWEIVFWIDENAENGIKPGVGQYVFIDSKGITQAVIERPFVFKRDATGYIEFLKNRGGVKNDDDEQFKNKTKTEIDYYDNAREKIIELAKNELTEGFEYKKVAIYHDDININFRYIVSFWENDTFEKGEHIFIDYNGVTKLIIYSE